MKVGELKRFDLPNCSFLVEKVQRRTIRYDVWLCDDNGGKDLYVGSFDTFADAVLTPLPSSGKSTWLKRWLALLTKYRSQS
jgi:hypothetical protein